MEPSAASPPSPRAVLPPLARTSHLPEWLLASTRAVEASQASRKLVEVRITGLRHSSLVLGGLIDSVNSSYAEKLRVGSDFRSNFVLVVV